MCCGRVCPPLPSVGYTRYLLDTLHKRELLSWLTLSPQRWWAALHYADDFNYGGVEATVSQALWEAGGVVGPAPTPGAPVVTDGSTEAEAASVAAAAAAAEIDEAEIGTPGGPRLRWVGWHVCVCVCAHRLLEGLLCVHVCVAKHCQCLRSLLV